MLFIGGGINHFASPEFYTNIMPDYLPLHTELVFLSGVAEFALGVMLLIPALSTKAAWGLIALLIAIFPANIHMATHPEIYSDMSPMFLYIRLPIQGLLIYWAYFYTRDLV